MKLVSVNAVLIGSINISLFFNTLIQEKCFPTISIFILSLIYICFVILLQYEHRQFKQFQIDITQSSFLLKRYLLLFILGLFLTFAQKIQFLNAQNHPQLKKYTLLGNSIHYSLLYYTSNTFLGLTYLFLFLKQYKKANKFRVQSQVVNNLSMNQTYFCSICLLNIQQGQKMAKIDCLHRFHTICLNKWIKKKPQCPICKTSIVLIQ